MKKKKIIYVFCCIFMAVFILFVFVTNFEQVSYGKYCQKNGGVWLYASRWSHPSVCYVTNQAYSNMKKGDPQFLLPINYEIVSNPEDYRGESFWNMVKSVPQSVKILFAK